MSFQTAFALLLITALGLRPTFAGYNSREGSSESEEIFLIAYACADGLAMRVIFLP
jgi:hypothetical protein